MASDIFMDKAAFIIFELEALIKRIDADIDQLQYTPTVNGKDISTVDISYKNGNLIKVNVECDSLSAIAIDVIKKIQ